MMYCTGGIRCERASALLTEIAAAAPEHKPAEIVMLQGGIERYVKTYADGGHWAGANFLFDKRVEQLPDQAKDEPLAAGVCVLCRTAWSKYRGGHHCAGPDCLGAAVPVLVCTDCQLKARSKKLKLRCPLCVEGFSLAQLPAPITIGQKALEGVAAKGAKRKRELVPPSTRLFVGKLPLTIDKGALQTCLGGKISALKWLVDKDTSLFYGSAVVELEQLAEAERAVENAGKKGRGTRIVGFGCHRKPRRLIVEYMGPAREGEEWPPKRAAPEFPPVPICPTPLP
jgi:hypothetical protein